MKSMIEQKRILPFIQKSAEELAFEIGFGRCNENDRGRID